MSNRKPLSICEILSFFLAGTRHNWINWKLEFQLVFLRGTHLSYPNVWSRAEIFCLSRCCCFHLDSAGAQLSMYIREIAQILYVYSGILISNYSPPASCLPRCQQCLYKAIWSEQILRPVREAVSQPVLKKRRKIHQEDLSRESSTS